ncbi:polysaccharide lyase 8 family protein [Draconibacterium sp.]
MKIFKKLLLIICLFSFIQIVNAATSDIETIRKRIVDELMKPAVDDAKIESSINTFKDDGTWQGINYEDVSREGFENEIHLVNMVNLARAYKTKSSKYYGSKKVKSVVESALRNWVDHDYFCENWHPNQIGTTGNLVTVMLLMGDELPKDLVEKAQPIIGRANLNASGARPSGDRIKIAGILAKNLIFIGDYKQFEEVLKVIEGEIKQVDWIGEKYGYGYFKMESGLGTKKYEGRGIQFDNSFHHRVDGVNNTLSYGFGYADAFVEWAVYTAGTQYEFSGEKKEQLVDYFLDGICKMSVYGKYPDFGAKNRSISRSGALRAYNAKMAENLLLTTNYRRNEIQEIADIINKDTKPTLSHATFYWNTEHFSFQRPNWFTSVRMYSTRNYNMEVPYNSEGLLNHHRGDGTNHISLTGDEYYDIAPVFDYQKIPGTTTMQKPALTAPDEIQKLGLTDFVGAVTDGLYGAVAFDFKSPHDPLCARKAWFFFDDEYVCLGAGISGKSELPVVTTLNQCLLRSDVTISSGNKKSVIAKGEKEFENIDWVFQDGVGYTFPKPSTVNIRNMETTGSWWIVNKQNDSPKGEVKMDVFKLWFNHGDRPSDASYEYIVVPATSVEKMEQNNSKNNIEMLSNTPEVQAVKNLGLNICQVVFYKTGDIQVSGKFKLISDNPGIVMLKMEGEKLSEISVSDPNRELLKFRLSVSSKIVAHGENFVSVWNETEGASEISIDLPQGNYAGKSVTIKL